MTTHENDQTIILAGHRGMGCTDHDFYQSLRDVKNLSVENTGDAVKQALESGAAYVEIDAVMSMDGVIFALHNVIVGDHFFGTQKPNNILNKIDFDLINGFKTGRHGKGDIALLSDILKIVDRYGSKSLGFDINIEIKGVQGSNQNYEDNDFIEALARTIRGSNIPAERVLFSSFCLMNIIKMSYLLPTAQFGMLFTQERYEGRPIYKNHVDDRAYQYAFFNKETIDHVGAYWQKNADLKSSLSYCHPEITTVTKDLLAYSHDKNMGLNCWALFETLDDVRKDHYKNIYHWCAEQGVSITVITDYLKEMIAFLKTLSATK